MISMTVDRLQFGRKLGFGRNAVVRQLFAHRLQDVEYDLVDDGRFPLLINSPEQGADSVEYFADAMVQQIDRDAVAARKILGVAARTRTGVPA